jgi:hypothetical protein
VTGGTGGGKGHGAGVSLRVYRRNAKRECE